MGKLEVRVIDTISNQTVEVITDCEQSIGEIFDALGDRGFKLGEVSLNGDPATPEDVPKGGDVVSSHETPAGN